LKGKKGSEAQVKKLTMLTMAMAAAGIMAAAIVMAADAVEPQTVAFRNIREEAETYASSAFYFVGTTLRMTNCQAFADTSGVVTQGLDEVTVEIAVGNTVTSIVYNATVTDAAAGLWSCDVVVPNLSTFFIQTKLTDASTNVFIYPWKYGRSKSSLGE